MDGPISGEQSWTGAFLVFLGNFHLFFCVFQVFFHFQARGSLLHLEHKELTTSLSTLFFFLSSPAVLSIQFGPTHSFTH